MYAVVTFTLILWHQVESIRIVDLQVPGHAPEGGSALLDCQFDLEGEELYSVKWYKDEREFYRYVPSNDEPSSYFPVPGVMVDMSRSSSTVVALERLARESAGLYRCEVSGEAPYFVTVHDEKPIDIHLLPRSGPRMVGLQTEYQIGDLLAVNCTSSRSRPRAQIKWLVNRRPVPKEYIRGPWIRLSRERSDAHDTTVELSFVLAPEHFEATGLILQCQASIAPLYQNEVIHRIQRVEDIPIDANEDFNNALLDKNKFVMSSKDDVDDDTMVPHDHSAVLRMSIWMLFLSIIIFKIR